MNIWWVNQGRCFKMEREDECVFAAESNHPNRVMVQEARVGDIVIHYAKLHIRAISIVQSDGKWSFNDTHGYEGWNFNTKYLDLAIPIHRDDVKEKIVSLDILEGPIESALNSPAKGRVKQGYFFRFNQSGLSAVKEAALSVGNQWPELG